MLKNGADISGSEAVTKTSTLPGAILPVAGSYAPCGVYVIAAVGGTLSDRALATADKPDSIFVTETLVIK